MKTSRSKAFLLPLLLSGVFLASCVTQKKPAFEPLLSQSRGYFEAGELQKAIDSYCAALKKYPQEKTILKEYIKTLEEMKRLADEASAKEDFASAGKAYSVLGKNHSFYEKVAQPPAFSSGSLEEGLKKCRTRLTQKGLEQYRKGNLAEAISLWQGILLFDPDNIEIKKAVDTATQQLKKLRKK